MTTLSDTLAGLAETLEAARSGQLTGIACKHGWDTSVCVMRGCGVDEEELIEGILNLTPTILAALRETGR